MKPMRHWEANGLTHVVIRMSEQRPYFAMCGFTLDPVHQVDVCDEGVPTCLACIKFARFGGFASARRVV